MEEVKMAYLASQQKVEELTEEMAKLQMEQQKQFEKFSKRIGQMQQEKGAESQQEESAEELVLLSIRRQMKILLAKETWFDALAFVPRYQLGQIVPEIGDRQFADIVQPFLHNYKEITLGNFVICPPRPRDGNDRPTLFAYSKYASWYSEPWYTRSQHLVLPDEEMPENIKNFISLTLRYLDPSAIKFLQKFHQNSLLENVNLTLLSIHTYDMDSLLTTLSHVMPLIDNNINSIHVFHIMQIGCFYDAKSEWTPPLLRMARILSIMSRDVYAFKPEEIELFNRWLYTPRADGKPRVLVLPDCAFYAASSDVLHFIDGIIKQEFSTAQSPCSFFIRLFVRDDFEWQDISMENNETKEKLVIKKVEPNLRSYHVGQKMALISRYPLNADTKWIEANEQEAVDWDFAEPDRRIELDNPIKIAI